MPKAISTQTTGTEADTPVADVRDPAQPIGTPPGGGTWTWDVPAQQWVKVPPQGDATPA